MRTKSVLNRRETADEEYFLSQKTVKKADEECFLPQQAAETEDEDITPLQSST